MDPRITVAWCKKVDLPIEKVFAQTLRDKFPWAMVVPTSFRFATDKDKKGEPEPELH